MHRQWSVVITLISLPVFVLSAALALIIPALFGDDATLIVYESTDALGGGTTIFLRDLDSGDTLPLAQRNILLTALPGSQDVLLYAEFTDILDAGVYQQRCMLMRLSAPQTGQAQVIGPPTQSCYIWLTNQRIVRAVAVDPDRLTVTLADTNGDVFASQSLNQPIDDYLLTSSPDGAHVLVAVMDREFNGWYIHHMDMATGEINALNAAPWKLDSFNFADRLWSADSDVFVTIRAADDNNPAAVVVFDVATGELTALPGEPPSVETLSWDRGGRYLIFNTRSEAGRVPNLFDVVTRTVLPLAPPANSWLNAGSPDGEHFLLFRQRAGEHTLFLGRYDDPTMFTPLVEGAAERVRADWSRDGHSLGYIFDPDTFRIRDMTTGDYRDYDNDGVTNIAYEFSLNPDVSTLARVVMTDTTLHFYALDPASGTIHRARAPLRGIVFWRWLPDGRHLFAETASPSGFRYLFSLDDFNVQSIIGHPGGMSDPAFSPDRRYALFASNRGNTPLNELYLLDILAARVERLTRTSNASESAGWFVP